MWECKFCRGIARYKRGDSYFCQDCNRNTQEPVNSEQEQQSEENTTNKQFAQKT